MSTGDIYGNILRLLRELKQIKCPYVVDEVGLRLGDPVTVLPLLNFSLLKFSRHVAKFLVSKGYELVGKTDQRFVEAAFKVLRDCCNVRTVLSPAQFLEQGFAERKVLLLCDVIQACKKLHNEEARKERLAAVKSLRQGKNKDVSIAKPDTVKLLVGGKEITHMLSPRHMPSSTDAGQRCFDVQSVRCSLQSRQPSPSGSAGGTQPCATGWVQHGEQHSSKQSQSPQLRSPLKSWISNPVFTDADEQEPYIHTHANGWVDSLLSGQQKGCAAAAGGKADPGKQRESPGALVHGNGWQQHVTYMHGGEEAPLPPRPSFSLELSNGWSGYGQHMQYSRLSLEVPLGHLGQPQSLQADARQDTNQWQQSAAKEDLTATFSRWASPPNARPQSAEPHSSPASAAHQTLRTSQHLKVAAWAEQGPGSTMAHPSQTPGSSRSQSPGSAAATAPTPKQADWPVHQPDSGVKSEFSGKRPAASPQEHEAGRHSDSAAASHQLPLASISFQHTTGLDSQRHMPAPQQQPLSQPAGDSRTHVALPAASQGGPPVAPAGDAVLNQLTQVLYRLSATEAELDRSRQEGTRLRDTMQARITVLEGRVRYLESEVQSVRSSTASLQPSSLRASTALALPAPGYGPPGLSSPPRSSRMQLYSSMSPARGHASMAGLQPPVPSHSPGAVHRPRQASPPHQQRLVNSTAGAGQLPWAASQDMTRWAGAGEAEGHGRAGSYSMQAAGFSASRPPMAGSSNPQGPVRQSHAATTGGYISAQAGKVHHASNSSPCSAASPVVAFTRQQSAAAGGSAGGVQRPHSGGGSDRSSREYSSTSDLISGLANRYSEAQDFLRTLKRR